jgi:hypothetical protein
VDPGTAQIKGREPCAVIDEAQDLWRLKPVHTRTPFAICYLLFPIEDELLAILKKIAPPLSKRGDQFVAN